MARCDGNSLQVKILGELQLLGLFFPVAFFDEAVRLGGIPITRGYTLTRWYQLPQKVFDHSEISCYKLNLH
jgi:hypothetical protein